MRIPWPRIFWIGIAWMAAFGIFRAVLEIHPILFLIFFAVLLAVILNYPVSWLSRWMPRAAAMPLVLLFFAALGSGLGALTIPTVVEQGKQSVQQIPQAVDKLQAWFERIQSKENVVAPSQGAQIEKTLKSKVGETIGTVLKNALKVLLGSVSAISGLLLLLILAIILAFSPETYRDGLKKWVPKKYDPVFDETWDRMSDQLGHWLVGILASMTIMGSLTAIGLKLVGVEQWPLLGLLTFFGTFIPYAGAIASAIIGLAIALAQSGQLFLATLGVYVGVHVVEGYIVQPLIMRRAVEIRPGLLIIWQASIGTFLGIEGIVVATPLLVCIQAGIEYLYFERILGKGKPASQERVKSKRHAA